MIHHVLNRCLVSEFYKQNAAFFGLLVLICFGFIKSSEHIAIGAFLVSNPSAMLIVMLIWIVYLIKVLVFVIPAINLQENRFLDVFLLLPVRLQMSSSAMAALLLLLPVLSYAAFLVYLSIQRGNWLSLIILLALCGVLIALLGMAIVLKLRQNHKEVTPWQIRFLNKFTKPFYVFFIEYLFRNDLVLLLLSKLYTCSVIIGTVRLYATDSFDIRLMTTGILLSVAGNIAILHKYVWFHFHKMEFSRNLPLSQLQVLRNHSIILLLLLLPEFVLILRHYPIPPKPIDLFGLLIFAFSMALFTFSLLIIRQKELSQSITSLFWTIAICTIIILFSVHPLIIGAIGILISMSVIYLRHDKFEYIE